MAGSVLSPDPNLAGKLADIVKLGKKAGNLADGVADAATDASKLTHLDDGQKMLPPGETLKALPPGKSFPVAPDISSGTTDFPVISGVKFTDKFTGITYTGSVDISPTITRINAGIKYPHKNDGTIFMNKGATLPQQPIGYYKEYVHPTPGVNNAGTQRIVLGNGGEIYYSPDHYNTFIKVR